jgi:hypothetical protein
MNFRICLLLKYNRSQIPSDFLKKSSYLFGSFAYKRYGRKHFLSSGSGSRALKEKWLLKL